MGSYGSGRHGGMRCTSGMLALDVRELSRGGWLKGTNSLNWRWSRNGVVLSSIGVLPDFNLVHLNYSHHGAGHDGGSPEQMSYAVHLDFTPSTFGGHRVWWLCPGSGCGKRVAVLYGGRVFACRHCHELAYRCQRETADDRARRRLDKLRYRLGWEAGILNDPGGKPKGMHWRTFWRLRAGHDAQAAGALEGLAAKIRLLTARIG